jgi:RNA polymerase sigma-70 factor (ECF subfamily)
MFTESTHSTESRDAVPHNSAKDLEATEEGQLISRLLADDPDAWRSFNARYSRLIYSCISKVMSRFSAVTGGDDVREVYATLCVQLLSNDKRKLRSFEANRGTKLGSWLGMLAVHATYDHLRAVRRAPALSPLVEAESLSAEMPSPFEQSLNRERALHVTRIMDSLSAKDQTFFQLYFAEGLSPEQVAERMAISVKTVYSKKHKITAKLEAMLSEERLAA